MLCFYEQQNTEESFDENNVYWVYFPPELKQTHAKHWYSKAEGVGIAQCFPGILGGLKQGKNTYCYIKSASEYFVLLTN